MIKVNIKKTVKDSIHSYSLSDTSRELGGVLLGHYKEKDGHYWLEIEEKIIARHTEAAKSNITFTHMTWEYINQVKDDFFPNLKMLGWFHTHPGFGIFLSKEDCFIQKNFFNESWSIAYVIDPVHNNWGFFGWSNGSIVRIPENDIKIIPAKAEMAKSIAYSNYRPRSASVQGYKPGIWEKIRKKILFIILILSLTANVYLWFGDDGFSINSSTNIRENTAEQTSNTQNGNKDTDEQSYSDGLESEENDRNKKNGNQVSDSQNKNHKENNQNSNGNNVEPKEVLNRNDETEDDMLDDEEENKENNF